MRKLVAYHQVPTRHTGVYHQVIGFQGNSSVKSKETRSYQRENVIVLYLAHKQHMPYKCAKYRHFPF